MELIEFATEAIGAKRTLGDDAGAGIAWERCRVCKISGKGGPGFSVGANFDYELCLTRSQLDFAPKWTFATGRICIRRVGAVFGECDVRLAVGCENSIACPIGTVEVPFGVRIFACSRDDNFPDRACSSICRIILRGGLMGRERPVGHIVGAEDTCSLAVGPSLGPGRMHFVEALVDDEVDARSIGDDFGRAGVELERERAIDRHVRKRGCDGSVEVAVGVDAESIGLAQRERRVSDRERE